MFAPPLLWLTLTLRLGWPVARPLLEPEAFGAFGQLLNLIAAFDVAVWLPWPVNEPVTVFGAQLVIVNAFCPPGPGDRQRQIGQRQIGDVAERDRVAGQVHGPDERHRERRRERHRDRRRGSRSAQRHGARGQSDARQEWRRRRRRADRAGRAREAREVGADIRRDRAAQAERDALAGRFGGALRDPQDELTTGVVRVLGNRRAQRRLVGLSAAPGDGERRRGAGSVGRQRDIRRRGRAGRRHAQRGQRHVEIADRERGQVRERDVEPAVGAPDGHVRGGQRCARPAPAPPRRRRRPPAPGPDTSVTGAAGPAPEVTVPLPTWQAVVGVVAARQAPPP